MRHKQVNDALVPLSAAEEAELDAREAAGWIERRTTMAQQVKASAREAITAVLPLWAQSNLHTSYLTLLRKGEAHWTAEEQAEVKRIEAVWEWIDAVRAASQALEEQVKALPADLDTFVWPDWPTPPG